MKKTSLLLALIIVFTACSDKNTNPNETKKFFGNNVKIGNYWIYSNKFIDTSEKVQDLPYTDSLAYIKDSIYDGKASKYMHYSGLDIGDTTFSKINYFMYEEDSKLFVSSDFFKIFVPFAGSALQSSKWFKIADINSSSWTLDSFKLDNLPIPIGETPVTFSGYLKLKVNKLANETLAMKWGNIDAYTFEIKGVISGKINLGGLPMPLADMDIFKVNLYFKEEKGLLQVSAKPFEINLMSGLAKFKVPGFEKLLIRTNVQ